MANEEKIYSANKTTQYVFISFIIFLFVITLFFALSAILRHGDGSGNYLLDPNYSFFDDMDFTGRLFFILTPLLPFLLYFIYFKRAYYTIKIKNDFIIFSGPFIKKIECEINDIMEIYPYMPKVSIISFPVVTSPFVIFKTANKSLDVFNDINNISQLLEYLKNKNKNLIIKDKWAILNSRQT